MSFHRIVMFDAGLQVIWKGDSLLELDGYLIEGLEKGTFELQQSSFGEDCKLAWEPAPWRNFEVGLEDLFAQSTPGPMWEVIDPTTDHVENPAEELAFIDSGFSLVEDADARPVGFVYNTCLDCPGNGARCGSFCFSAEETAPIHYCGCCGVAPVATPGDDCARCIALFEHLPPEEEYRKRLPTPVGSISNWG